MDEKPTTRTSRRALLAAAGGAAAALAADSLAKPLAVAANNGDALKLGRINTATVGTGLDFTANNIIYTEAALLVKTHRQKVGFKTDIGVFDDGIAILGNVGGVRAVGVRGVALNGIGVEGNSEHGTGLLASSNHGLAFQAAGTVRFQTAGFGTVPQGYYTTRVHPNMGGGMHLTADTKVLVTLLSNPVGPQTVWVDVGTVGDVFDIHLSAPAIQALRFAYFVIS